MNRSDSRTQPGKYPNRSRDSLSLGFKETASSRGSKRSPIERASIAMLASLGSLLSSLPFFVPPTEKPPPPPPAPFPKPKTDGFPPASIRSLAPVQPPAEVTMPAEKEGIVCSCYPSLALANLFYARGGYYNAQVVVGEDEPEDVLLRRFKREVMKAGVIQECKRRRWFENEQEKKKRKARDAARRNRKRSAFDINYLLLFFSSTNFRHYQPKVHKQDNQEEPKAKLQEDEEDNWEIPEGELPYCARMP
ncbi:hypothetical protein BHE74_00049480 [Ensete ventricosum]|nr:hypothetical protein GW17_00041439 [Ensete ventricosum]RWW44739.1 hypothetical protein BHE74_00049480 [Ensete ventricosum]